MSITANISELNPKAGLLLGSELLEVDDGASKYVTVDQIAAVPSPCTALAIAAGVVAIDLALGDYFTLALTANVTGITFANLPAAGRGRTIMIRLKQDATGGRTVALPASFKGISGTDLLVQSAANATTILAATTFDQGTRWEYSMKGAAA